MPFDPDEVANGLQRWLEHGRKPKPEPAVPNPYDPGVIYQNPEPSPPPAEMPGSGPSIEELQEQIKALQEQLKAMEGDGGAHFVPHLKVPGPELTPEERLERDWEIHRQWMQGSGGEPHFAIPRRPDIPHPDDDDIKADMPSWGPYRNAPRDGSVGYEADMPSWGPYRNAPRDGSVGYEADMPRSGPYRNAPRDGYGGYEYDVIKPDPMGELAPRERPRWGNLPYIREEDGPQEKPNWENLPYRYKEPKGGQPYELLNGTGSPVEGLNLKVGRHGNSYSPSTVTPGKGASLN